MLSYIRLLRVLGALLEHKENHNEVIKAKIKKLRKKLNQDPYFVVN
jgi:hypothetical protein